MDRIEKALNRLTPKEKQRVKGILLQIEKGDFKKLSTKKLIGKNNIFRIRKGSIRIILHKKNDSIKVLTIERRESKTYKKK
ncbi:MAG: hypothetical protein ABH889_01490 [Candidatus Portnoybacteria bacterium]